MCVCVWNLSGSGGGLRCDSDRAVEAMVKFVYRGCEGVVAVKCGACVVSICSKVVIPECW